MRHIAHGGVVTLCGAQTEGNNGKNNVIEWQLLASADYAPLVTCDKCKGVFTAHHFGLDRFNMGLAEKLGFVSAKEEAHPASAPFKVEPEYQQPAKQEVKAFTALDEINKHGESIEFLYEQLKFYREKTDNLLERMKIQEELLRATNDAIARLATKTDEYHQAIYGDDGLNEALIAVEAFLEKTFTEFQS